MGKLIKNELAESLPRLLYVCDFPPSNLRGGTILISRLLSDYPKGKLIITSSVQYLKDPSYKQAKWDCKTISFPLLNPTGRWGLGRLKSTANWFSLPILCILLLWQIKKENIESITTIAHGYFFIAATIVARISRTPLLLIVHDDWVDDTCRNSLFIKYYVPSLFRWIVQSASHIYAVSHGMQLYLKSCYNVSSELQLAAIELPPNENSITHKSHCYNTDSLIKIAYAGTITAFVSEGIELIVKVINENKNLELHLFTPDIPQEVKMYVGQNARVLVHAWLSQSDLNQALSNADILFLPISFHKEQKALAKTSFPSKLATYLLASRPILILGPAYASLIQYAYQFGFAEIVDEPNIEKLTSGVKHIIDNPNHRSTLLQQTISVLQENHNIAKQKIDFQNKLIQLTRNYPKT